MRKFKFVEYRNWVWVWRTLSLWGGNQHGESMGNEYWGRSLNRRRETPENWERSPNRGRSPRLSRGRGLRMGPGEPPGNFRKFIILNPCNLVYSWSENLFFAVADPGIWWRWERITFRSHPNSARCIWERCYINPQLPTFWCIYKHESPFS